MSVLLWLAAVLVLPAGLPAETIEDFEDASVELHSYADEDVHPDSWVLDSVNTHNDSRYSLRLFGNTWKLESISPVAVDSGDVWQVAACVAAVGEIQGFILLDSANALRYAFAGTQQLAVEDWVTVYQGAYPRDTWRVYELPVADDWLARYGYLPTVTAIAFVNDRDDDPEAVVLFDDVLDITDDLPVAPEVDAWYEVAAKTDNGDGTWDVEVRFHSRVTDPDSDEHLYFWHFGDGATSDDSSPVHSYTVADDHEYTVLLRVADEVPLWGRATCRVTVDPGPTSYPVRVNFVGDVMIARRYENPGGVLDTLGVRGIFDPTLPWLGDAADITVANLECPLTLQGERHPTKPIVFRGRPGYVAGLVHAGIDVVSLANNHVIDYGLAGLEETQGVLSGCDIVHSGAGADADEAYLPAFHQHSGVNFAFLAYSDRTGQYDNYQPYLNAGRAKPGFAEQDTFRMFRVMESVRDDADFVVVELHAGEEYSPTPWDEDESYSPFALAPSPADREIRRRLVDEGADVVICHHPHVLQGMEEYGGVLIVHSLGNFVFDQNYPETYPSLILNAAVDERGFHDYSLTPVYIDDYVPMRARGELGLHILDYIARLSREMETWVIVDRDSVTAAVVLDTAGLTPRVHSHVDPVELREENDFRVSEPLRLRRQGSLSSVVSVAPAGNWQFRLGREAVWFGNCEDEGATMWWLNHEDEFYDTVACRGRRSLCQRRPEGNGPLNTDFEERIVCYSDTGRYTLHASIRTENAAEAGVSVRFFSWRTSSYPIGTGDLGTEVAGTTGWQSFHNEFVPEDGTGYFDVRLRSVGPDSGDGRAWFDDVGIIEWGDWRTLNHPVTVDQPNDYYWVQVRTHAAVADAEVAYQETSYDPPTALAGPARTGVPGPGLRSYPNPARAGAAIRYGLATRVRVALRVYNVLGQEVRTLVDRVQDRGTHTVSWDGRDARGAAVPAGTYFCRLKAGATEQTQKVVLSR